MKQQQLKRGSAPAVPKQTAEPDAAVPRWHLKSIFLIGLPLGVVILAGIQLAWDVVVPLLRTTESESSAAAIDGPSLPFLNPLSASRVYQELWFDELIPFGDKVEEYLESRAERSSMPAHVSVYFRDLNNGYWFGINEDHLFCPASLMKVPLLIAYLKKAETDSELLEKVLPYVAPVDSFTRPEEAYLDKKTNLVSGQSYSVEQLLEFMIVDSDNEATLLLHDNLDKEFFRAVQEDLGFRYSPSADLTSDILSVKRYSAFFRILYNASYVNKELSHKGLSMLARSNFSEGIRQGIPPTIPVCHKFGIRIVQGPSGISTQFHHAGIIYHPRKPFLLCVMTRGKDKALQTGLIRDVAKLIYEEVDRQTKTGHRARLQQDIN